MKTLVHLVMMTLIATWLGAIAIFSIQNVTVVSSQFLGFSSIKMPVGVMLAFCAGGGMIFGAIFPLLLPNPRNRRSRNSDNDLDVFDF